MWKETTLVAAFAVVGCGRQTYGYRPGSLADGTPARAVAEAPPQSQAQRTAQDGYLALRYVVTAGGSRGEATISCLGFVEHQVAPQVIEPLLRVRLTLAREGLVGPHGDDSWVLDPSRQLLALPGHRPYGPTHVHVEGEAGPSPTVTAGGRLVVDLLYAVPPMALGERRLPGFEVHWNVSTPKGVQLQRTSFERFAVTPPPAPPAALTLGPGHTPPWWRPSRAHRPTVQHPFFPPSAMVARPRVVFRLRPRQPVVVVPALPETASPGR